jgi:diaminohydroxyphosphoribosylaminopyrimidine deaminase/5-amino-6-(5-phosphoribosylamino)uracil reductase
VRQGGFLDDLIWMRRAIELAERGRGWVEPNPLVGAVIVCDNQIVGEGWHERFGEAHAEVHALAQAGPRSRGATLYVTLEPCCHYGKTPPCTEAIIAAGLRRIVVAMTDPFPQVAGGGIQQLRNAGLTVEVGVLETDARRLNAPYLTRMEKGRVYVHAKWAMTLDGKIATTQGDSRWISSENSRRRVHQMRGKMDAIIVGAGTVRTDDPWLTARPPGPRTPSRIVLTRTGQFRSDCRLFQTVEQAPVVIAGPRADLYRPIVPAPVELIACESVTELLRELARRGMTNVLVEGGAVTLGSFFDEKLIDEVHVFIASRLIGGGGPGPMRGAGLPCVKDSQLLTDLHVEAIGPDWYFHGTTRWGMP